MKILEAPDAKAWRLEAKCTCGTRVELDVSDIKRETSSYPRDQCDAVLYTWKCPTCASSRSVPGGVPTYVDVALRRTPEPPPWDR